MKPVSQEEYKAMQAKDWEWAKALIQCQIDDKRPGVQHLTNRPIINIKQMLESSAELYGDGIAFYTKFEKGPYTTITHREVFNDVNGMGTALIAHGMKDKRIAVIGETTYMWGIGYLGTVCGTGIVVPLDKELSYNELKNLINEAECSAIIFDKKREATFVKMMEEGETGLELLISQDRSVSQWELIAEGKQLIEQGDRSFLDAQIDSQEMSIIIFTSGTTGMAKGIMLSHRNIAADLMVSPTLVDFLPSDIFFSVLPIHHTFECTCNFIMPLYKGGAIAHCEGLKYIVKNIQEVHPTFLLAVPAIFEALHKAIWKGIRAKGKEKTVRKAMKICKAAKKVGIDLTNVFFKEIKQTLGGRMRMMICGGAAINPEILEDLQAFGIMALQGYGLSEAAPMGALNPENKPKSNSCGIAFPGFDAKIADPGADGIGEICLKGDNIMLGYYKNEEALKAKALELLAIFGLEKEADTLAKNLAYGQQRHLEIVRALATEPKILFLDEPAAGMNPQETAELTQLIRRIQKEFNITIMLIEHDMSLVMEVTERIYVLEYGRLIAHGTPDEIKTNKRVIEAYLGGEA